LAVPPVGFTRCPATNSIAEDERKSVCVTWFDAKQGRFNSSLSDWLAARNEASNAAVQVAGDIGGREVLTAYAMVASSSWLVFVETPTEEADTPAR
jgi:hypothetical protein